MRLKSVFLILLLLVCGFFFDSKVFSKGLIKGKIIFLKGKGDIVRSSRKYKAKLGFQLITRDTIVTKSNSLVVIKLSTGDNIKIRSNSVVTITQLSTRKRKTRLHLHKGGLLSKVNRLKKRNFTVNTPSSVAGVRGTTFFIGSSNKSKKDRIGVKKGLVHVRNTNNESGSDVQTNQGVEYKSNQTVGKAKVYQWMQEINWSANPLKWNTELPSLKTRYHKVDGK